MTKMFAISALALGMLAQSAQAATVQAIDGDANPIPGVSRVQTERFVRHQAVRVSANPMNAFAAFIAPVRPMWHDLGIDGDANPVPGVR